MRRSALGIPALFSAVLLATACGRAPEPEAPLFENLGGDVHREVSTRSAVAQRYFDQGLTFCWGFNHEEAIRSFQEAARQDPNCAMAYWGMALAAGPNINNPAMDDSTTKAAVEAVKEAERKAGRATPVEKDLIAALTKRYAYPPPEDRKALDQAYADAMREVWKKYPQDPDVGALFAEALMDLRPWDLWSPAGEPRPETPEVLATIEAVLALAPQHVGANHYQVHACEASPDPGKALPSADLLRTLVPGAGHLVHMPAHIDIRVGHYDEAIAANQRGIAADLAYVERVGRGGFYTVYRAHNYHFLAYAAMFDGQRAMAMQAARDMIQEVPLELVREIPNFLDAFLATPYHVMVRFGLWEDLLKEPAPPADLLATTAFWHGTRTVALAALGRVDEATAERAAFETAYAAVPEDYLLSNNPVRAVLDVARPFVEGELEYRKGHVDRAFELLREAVKRDEALRYDEPWGWMEPVSHALGALLLEQGRVEEATAVYRRDLELHPDNGWALHGLAECLRRSGKKEEAVAVEARFQRAWSAADIAIKGSCYCRTKA
jgi:tetratricopeptide (TPR) repeat protein